MREPDVAGLADSVTGTVIGRDDPEYAAARMPWNMREQRPAAVVEVQEPADVAASLTFAADNGLQVAAQPTGHAASWDYADTILLRMGGLREVAIDPVSRTARFGAGVQWQDVLAPAAEHGLTALSGTAPHVGAVGYTLGGGLGWLARRHGLCANRLRAADLVLADGTMTQVDETSDEDLFWALRGGGGNYAIVTAMEMELVEQPEVYAGNLVFPLVRAPEIVPAWRDWVSGLADEVTSTITLLRIPDMPTVPEPLRGQELTVVSSCHSGQGAGREDVFAPMLALGPIMDTLGVMSPTELGALHNDPVDPIPASGGGAVIGELDDATIGRVLDTVGPDSGSPLLLGEIRHCGGGVRNPPVPGGVCSGFAGEFISYAVGVLAGPRAGEVAPAIDAFVEAQSAQSTGELILNFAERPEAVPGAFAPDSLTRLRQIKAARDPGNLIVSSHPLG